MEKNKISSYVRDGKLLIYNDLGELLVSWPVWKKRYHELCTEVCYFSEFCEDVIFRDLDFLYLVCNDKPNIVPLLKDCREAKLLYRNIKGKIVKKIVRR